MNATSVSTRLSVSGGMSHLQCAHSVDVLNSKWLSVLKEEVDRSQQAIQACPVLVALSRGTFSHSQMQDCLIQLYPVVKTFPVWIGLLKEKVADRETRAVLAHYGRRVSWYVPQWILMAEGFGLRRQELFESPVRGNVHALNQYLWWISRWGSLAEGIMSLGYAIGSVTRLIAPCLLAGFTYYEQRTGTVLTKKASSWVRRQALSRDSCLHEFLEITQASVSSSIERDAVSKAVIRSLAHLRMALEECGTTYDPWNAYRRIGHNAA